MGDVVKFKRPPAAAKNRGRTLCAHNFHKWEIVTKNRFDVRAGRLVTVLRCARCGKEQQRLT